MVKSVHTWWRAAADVTDHTDESERVGKLSSLHNKSQLLKLRHENGLLKAHRGSETHLSVPLELFSFSLTVLHIQTIFIARVVIRAQQLRQRVIELCNNRNKLAHKTRTQRSCDSITSYRPCRLSSVALFRSSSSRISLASYTINRHALIVQQSWSRSVQLCWRQRWATLERYSWQDCAEKLQLNMSVPLNPKIKMEERHISLRYPFYAFSIYSLSCNL